MAEEWDVEITFLPTNTSKIHLHVEQLLQNTYWTLAEDLRLPERQETPHVLGRAKEKRKNRDKRIGTGRAPLGRSCEGGKVPHTRKCLHRQRRGVAGWGELRSHGGEHSNRGAEGKAERFPHRGLVPTSTHQLERLVCSPAGSGGGWELRLRLRRSDPRERIGVGCVNTAWRGLVCHS